jgi:hypothetical protein
LPVGIVTLIESVSTLWVVVLPGRTLSIGPVIVRVLAICTLAVLIIPMLPSVVLLLAAVLLECVVVTLPPWHLRVRVLRGSRTARTCLPAVVLPGGVVVPMLPSAILWRAVPLLLIFVVSLPPVIWRLAVPLILVVMVLPPLSAVLRVVGWREIVLLPPVVGRR